MSLRAPLRSPAFRRYVIGQVVSVTCSWVQVVALSWVVVDRYPTALGWVVAVQFAPTILLGPWFGAVTDRHDRKRLVMLAEGGLGLVAVAFAAALVTGTLTLPLVAVLAIAWGVLNALDTPARRALIPALVTGEAAASASAITGMVLLLGMTTGSALGAALVANFGAAMAFAVNAASFCLDVILLATIHIRPSPRADPTSRPLRDGLDYVWGTRRLRLPLLALVILSTFAFTIQVSVPIHMTGPFGGGPTLVGAGFTAVTAGGLAGAAIAAVRGAPGPHSLRLAASAMGVAMLLCFVAPTAPIALAALAGVGFAWSLFVASTIATLQTAEASMLGRVMSWLAVVLIGGMAAGGPLAGFVAGLGGPRAPFLMGAAASAVAAAIVGSRTASAEAVAAHGSPTIDRQPATVDRLHRRSSLPRALQATTPIVD